jgi:hypothetical protein
LLRERDAIHIKNWCSFSFAPAARYSNWTQLSIAHELAYLDTLAFKELNERVEGVGRVLNGLINRFQAQIERAS